jgi:hypothetical protein
MGSCLKKVAEKSPAKWVWFVAEKPSIHWRICFNYIFGIYAYLMSLQLDFLVLTYIHWVVSFSIMGLPFLTDHQKGFSIRLLT